MSPGLPCPQPLAADQEIMPCESIDPWVTSSPPKPSSSTNLSASPTGVSSPVWTVGAKRARLVLHRVEVTVPQVLKFGAKLSEVYTYDDLVLG